MSPTRYLENYRQGSYYRQVECLEDFLEAVAAGEDLWQGGIRNSICYSSTNGSGDYEALKALGWSAGFDYGSHGSEWMYVYSPHSS